MNRVIYRIYRKKKDLDKISPKTEKRYTIERNLRLSNSLRQHEYRAISLEGYRRTRLGLSDRLLSRCSVTYRLIKKRGGLWWEGKERKHTRGDEVAVGVRPVLAGSRTRPCRFEQRLAVAAAAAAVVATADRNLSIRKCGNLAGRNFVQIVISCRPSGC